MIILTNKNVYIGCSSFSESKILTYNLMYTTISISIIYESLKHTNKYK